MSGGIYSEMEYNRSIGGGGMSTIHRRWSHSSALANLVLSIPIVLLLAACGGGSSDPPIAGALVPGQGPVGQSPGNADLTQVTVRSGSEVVLNGENSDGIAYPLASAEWRQTDSTGVVVRLDKRTGLTRAFRVPDVDVPTKLTFALAVTNQGGKTSTKSVEVDVVPVHDSDEFLEFFRSLDGSYTVVAALAAGVSTTSDVTFTVTQRQLVDYADRTAVSKEPNQFNVEIGTAKTASSAWLNGITAKWTTADEAIAAYYHPHLSFVIPKLDIDDINILFDDTNPGRGIAEYQRDTVRHSVELSLEVTGGSCVNAAKEPMSCSDAVILFVLDSAGRAVQPTVAGVSEQSTTGTLRIAVDDLKALQPSEMARTAPESATTAAAYYAAVDPSGKRTTLSDWLENAGFTVKGKFIDQGEYAHALYVNNYDLGFTRDMFVRTDPNTGEVFAYVTNFPALRPALVRSQDPAHIDDDVLATVAMEYSRPDQATSAEPIVKFFVFIPDGKGNQQRVNSLNFDGRGEKWVPGACTPCHGGTVRSLNPDKTYPDNGKIDAAFLPWDLDSFLYVKADNANLVDPLVTAGFKLNPGYLTSEQLAAFSREAQDPAFRKMNEAVLLTMPEVDRFTLVREQIHGWYGVDSGAGNVLPADKSFSADYDTAIQTGWRGQSAEVTDFYKNVFAHQCRICHSQAIGINKFASYQDFRVDATKDLIRKFVFEDGVMPNSRLDMDRLWVNFHGGSPPAEQLAKLLFTDAEIAQGDLLKGPGLPVARLPTFATLCPLDAMLKAHVQPTAALLSSCKNIDYFRFDDPRDAADATNRSSFVEAFHWTFLSKPEGSGAQLTGADTAMPAFYADKGGPYVVQLDVCKDQNNPRSQCKASTTVDASFYSPKLQNNNGLTIRESTPDQTSVATISSDELSFIDQDSPATALTYTIEKAPDNGDLLLAGSDALPQPYSCSLKPAGALKPGSTFTQDDIDNNRLSYSQCPEKDLPSDSFTFDVMDEGGRVAQDQTQTFNVSIVLGTNDRPTQVNSGPLHQVPEGGTKAITRGELEWADSDSPDSSVQYSLASPSADCPLGLRAGRLTNCVDPASVTTFTQDQIGSDQIPSSVCYLHDGSEVHSDDFRYSVTDGTSDPQYACVKIEITPSDNAPLLLDGGQVTGVHAGLAMVITGRLITAPPQPNARPNEPIVVVDPDTAAGSIKLTVIAPTSANGSLELFRSNAWTAIKDLAVAEQSFTLQEVLDGHFRYRHVDPYIQADIVDGFSLKAEEQTLDGSTIPANPTAQHVSVPVAKRTDGPANANSTNSLTLTGYIDPSIARDGNPRKSGDQPIQSDGTSGWRSVVLNGTSDLNYFDQNPISPDGTASCAIKYTLTSPLPVSPLGVLQKKQADGTWQTIGAGDGFEQVADVNAGNVRYLNNQISNHPDSFTFTVSDCSLELKDQQLTVTRAINPGCDIGWVIDSVWTDGASVGTCDPAPNRACRQCHDADTSTFVCGLFDPGLALSFTNKNTAQGVLNFTNLERAYGLTNPNPLPDTPTTTGHGGGQVIIAGSYPHLMLKQWALEKTNGTFPEGPTTCAAPAAQAGQGGQ